MRKLLLLTFIVAGLNITPGRSFEKTNPFPPLPGWTLAVDSMVYTPDNLWNIIDGAADAFLLYGFIDLHIGEYMNPDSVDVRAELYRHSSAANAFGMYSQERKPDYNFIDIGTEGYIEDGVLNFLCGSYYVKLTSHTTEEKEIAALRSVAAQMVLALLQDKGFPPQLALLPAEGKVKRSESYIADSYLGYSFFRSAWVAQYDSAGKVQLFVMQFESAEAAQQTLKAYVEKLKISKNVLKDGAYTLVDQNNGTIGMLLKGKYLCGVVNCEDEKSRDRYLDDLAKSATH